MISLVKHLKEIAKTDPKGVRSLIKWLNDQLPKEDKYDLN